MATEVLQRSAFEIEVEKLVKKQKRTYKNDHDRIISDFHAEKEITNSYNGRQLLELLQNADDAGTDEVLIVFDRKERRLKVANNGNPFDINGVKSLMLAHKSSKNKRNFIGNKGLGFRSVLNWVNKVKIKTRSCILEFSPAQAKANFEELISDISERLELINNEEELNENEVPFGILSLPKYSKNKNHQEWETIIELNYDVDYEKDIENQVKDIQPEILLFLKNIRKITIKGAEDSDEVLQKKDIPTSEKNLKRIAVNGVEYNIYSVADKPLPDKKKKFYSYKIAWQDDLSNQASKFFTYFPTQVHSHLPFLIHGTFDLDPTRNHFNKSEDNHFILNEIAKIIGQIALKYLKKEGASDWRAYRFLSVTGKSDNKHLESFFERIREQRDELEIYPTVDNCYTCLENVIEYEYEFPQWVLSNNFGVYFPNLSKPVNFERHRYYTPDHYTPKELVCIFEKIASKMESIQERVKVVKILCSSEFHSFHLADGIYLPLLLNNQNEPVLDGRQVFAMEKGVLNDYKLPEGVKMEFISAQMLELLKQEFHEEIDKDVESRESKGRNRSLRRLIGDIVNLGSDDVNELIRFVVKESESTHGESEGNSWVKSMVSSLFALYSQKSQARENILSFDVPLLNRKGRKVSANKLFYGKDYEHGKITEEIFEGVYEETDFLLGPEDWSLGTVNNEELQSFFSWLGVNRFLQYEEVDRQLEVKDGYLEYVFKNIPEPEPVTTWFYTGRKILREELITRLSPEKLVLLIAMDNKLKNCLERENDTKLSHKYSNRYNTIYSHPSIIEYQLIKNSSFENIMIEDEIGLSDSLEDFDVDHPLLKKHHVDADEVKWIIGRLGAIKSIADLDRKQFYKLFDQVEPSNSQSFYKRFFDYCTSREDKDEKLEIDFTGLKCYARKGGKGKELELKPVSEIYYSDNSIVPQKILNDYWILNLPKRKGELYVQKFFGVKLLKEEFSNIDVRVNESSFLANEFSNYINKLKEYFLCYRLSTVKTVQQEKVEVDAIKKLEIKLVNDCSFSFNDKKVLVLDENSFIAEDDVYYIKNARSGSIKELKREPEFCDSIAEILSIQFKVKEHKNSFRSIFKDGVKETEHLIRKDELENNLEKARILLGVSSEEMTFWKNVFQLKNLILDELQEKAELQSKIEESFGYMLPVNYNLVDFKDLSKNATFEFLKQLCSDFQANLKKLVTWETDGFKEYYKIKLQDNLFSKKEKFKQLAWLNTVNSNRQQEFLNKLYAYDQFLESPLVFTKLESVQFSTDWDPEEFTTELIENESGIQWVDQSEDIKIKNLYVDLLKEADITEDEFDNETRSLFFFPDNEERIKSKIKEIQKAIEDEEEKTENEAKIGKLIFDSSTSPVSIKPSKSTNGNKKGWTHGNKDDRRNKRLGKIAENITYNSLVEKFGEQNVKWISGNSDTADKSDEEHYDIRYKKPGEEWYYLEVKAFNGQFFYLSREEKRFAQEKKDRYEIALVHGENIHVCSEFFADDVEFDSNKKFNATPGDYLISLKIKKD